MGVVQRLVKAKPDAYLTELAEQFTQQTGIPLSRVTRHRCLQRLRLSTKKTLHANEQDTERVQALRHEYRRWLDWVDSRNFVFSDESGVNLAIAWTITQQLLAQEEVIAGPSEQWLAYATNDEDDPAASRFPSLAYVDLASLF